MRIGLLPGWRLSYSMCLLTGAFCKRILARGAWELQGRWDYSCLGWDVMPLVRSDESRDPIGPYVVLLWKRKWFIAGVAILLAVLTYVALLFVSSTFRVHAEIFVNQLPSVPEGQAPNPDTVASMMVSQSVLGKVRDDLVEKFGIEPPPIERFGRAFKVNSTILQDTTVRRELSPVLELTVEGKGPEATRFTMERWIHHFVADFGNYVVQEAALKRNAYLTEISQVESRMSELSEQRVAVETRLPYLRKLYAEQLELLSPARLRENSRGDDRANSSVELYVPTPRMKPGLLERLSELQLQVRSGTAPTTAAQVMAALQASINDAETSIAAIQQEYARAINEDDRLSREIEMIEQLRSNLNSALARVSVAAAVQRHGDDNGLPTGGDIRALSMPVTPEARVWPKRTFAAAAAGVAGGVMAIFFVLLSNYMANLTPVRREE